jgi:hypothetical protein
MEDSTLGLFLHAAPLKRSVRLFLTFSKSGAAKSESFGILNFQAAFIPR